MSKEKWVPVIGYEELYEINQFGSVRKVIIRKIFVNPQTGYLTLTLCKGAKHKNHSVHQLVYESFRGRVPGGLVIHHKDANRQNPFLNNLEAVTQIQNLKYARDAGRYPVTERMRESAKINVKIAQAAKRRAIVAKDSEGNIRHSFKSMSEAERALGIPRNNVSRAVRKVRKTCHGFTWDYKDN